MEEPTILLVEDEAITALNIKQKLDAIYYLSTIIINGFVMVVGYLVFILYLGGLIKFSLTAPLIIVLLSTVAFFPGVISGTWHDSKKITITSYQSLKYWIHCFYLIPLFVVTLFNLFTRRERIWA